MKTHTVPRYPRAMWRRCPLLLVVAAALACSPEATPPPMKKTAPPPPPTSAKTPAPNPEPEQQPEQDPAPASFEAKVRIDPHPGGKRFQGVWLDVEGRDPWLVAYRARPWWKPFDGHRVKVVGAPYQPDPQAQQIMADHFRVTSLELLDPAEEPMAEIVWIGPQLTLEGTFATITWPQGTKLAGETMTVFETQAGKRYHLAASVDPMPEPGAPLTVRGRAVRRSPFVAHVGTDHLWVFSATPRD